MISMFKNYKFVKQKIKGKQYKLFIADSDKKKIKGLAGIKMLPARTGMLFPYADEKENRTFTMKNVFFPLRLIFLNKKMEIVHQVISKPGQKNIICKKPSQYVIEILP